MTNGLHQGNLLWIGVAVYLILMILLGIFAGRRVRSLADFLVAGRRLPFSMATATLLATWFGAGTCIGIAAAVYQGDLRSVIADPFAVSLSLVLAGFLLVGVLRRLRCMTVTDIIQERFGRGAGIYASLWMIPAYIGSLSAQILGIGMILNLITGLHPVTAQLIAAAVVLIYTVAGGMWAVTLTDAVQIVLIAAGLLLVAPFAIREAGGMEAVFCNPAVDYSLLPAACDRGSASAWVNYTGNWLIMGLGCMVGQDLLQRTLSCRTSKIAVATTFCTAILYFLLALIPVAIGLTAKILLPKWGVESAALDGALQNQVMPRIAAGVLGGISPWLLLLFFGALISAVMSTADSSLLAASGLLVRNVIQPLLPELPEEKQLLLTRIATVVILVLSTVLALAAKSVYSLMISAWASQLVIVLIPVFAAVYLPHTKACTIWHTMLTATAVWLGYMIDAAIKIPGTLLEILDSGKFQYELTNGSVYGFAAGLIVFGISAIFTRR